MGGRGIEKEVREMRDREGNGTDTEREKRESLRVRENTELWYRSW